LLVLPEQLTTNAATAETQLPFARLFANTFVSGGSLFEVWNNLS
jgi:hypothetical protein